ncbi:hypothetical protein [Roseofilum capinflatum]|uniref:Uncharacterized protein n=1 Tax=Roseofilum capinflatum BLCC-M114 TaxID=3022440 RepID=A0ABT7B6A2_9CYAN|nr:hypothetical protein [Roseofilum capinflatum]MDJ1174702.1 hypothetical protein [Roseofilum capinflatum BLCC-M114]
MAFDFDNKYADYSREHRRELYEIDAKKLEVLERRDALGTLRKDFLKHPETANASIEMSQQIKRELIALDERRKSIIFEHSKQKYGVDLARRMASID